MTPYVIIHYAATEIIPDHDLPIAPDALNISCSTISSIK